MSAAVGYTQLRTERKSFARIIADTHRMVNEHRRRSGMPEINFDEQEPSKMADETGTLCGCGKASNHIGMCKVRAAKARATREARDNGNVHDSVRASAAPPEKPPISARSFLKDAGRKRNDNPITVAIDAQIATMESELGKLRRARFIIEGI